jgi:predicted enzyme related to lactoylglutathione lyase
MDKVQHFEIPADDIARARKFYESTFDWKTTEWPMPGGGVYIGLHTGPTDEKYMAKESGFINGGCLSAVENLLLEEWSLRQLLRISKPLLRK